jgi:hypothetical protein
MGLEQLDIQRQKKKVKLWFILVPNIKMDEQKMDHGLKYKT